MSLRSALRHRAQMAQAFGMPKPRVARTPRIRPARYPHAPQLAYLRGLLEIVATIREALERHVVPALPALVAAHAASRPQHDVFDARGQRIAIVGAPRAGKTTLALELAAQLGLQVQSSDDLIPLGWSEASRELAERIAASDSGIFEGVAVIRALRKLLERSPDKPVDKLLLMLVPMQRLTDGQRAMASGVRTVVQATLPTLIARGVEVYYDSEQLRADLPVRLDAADDDPTVELFSRVSADVDNDVSDGRIALLAQQNALRVDEHGKRELSAQIKQVVAIDLHAPDTGVPQHVRNFVAQQVTLVKGLKARALADTHSVVLEGVRQGLRAEEIAKQLRVQVGLSKTRATIIANDQVGKLHGELTRLRQTSLGIKRYKWATSRDELVRPGHRALEGTTQSWDLPPIVNAKTGKRAHPGFDTHFYPCRCSAIPMIEDLLEEAGLSTVPPPAPPPANTNVAANTNAAKPKRVKPAPLPAEHTPAHWLPHYAKEYGDVAPALAWGRAMGERGRALSLSDFQRGAKKLSTLGIEGQDGLRLIFVKDAIAKHKPRSVAELLDALAKDREISEVRRTFAREIELTSKLVAHHKALAGKRSKISLKHAVEVTSGSASKTRVEAARARAQRVYEAMSHKDIEQPVDYRWLGDTEKRAFQREPTGNAAGVINFGSGDPLRDAHLLKSTMHEWGHAIESLNASRMKSAVQFLEARAGAEAPVPLDSMPGNAHRGYEPHERAVADKFFSPYMGKEYRGSGRSAYNGRNATEVTAMAVQHLHEVAMLQAEVVSKDPDVLDWLLGQLANQ